MEKKQKYTIAILIVIIISVLCAGLIIMNKTILQKDFKIENVFWTQYDADENGYVTGESIYMYHNGEIECIDHQGLNNASKYGDTIVGLQNASSNSEGYQGIVLYDINTKEVQEILSCERIDDFFGVNENEGAWFEGCIQMSEDENRFYFSYSEQLSCYDREMDELSILVEDAYLGSVVLNEEETGLYYSDSGTLMFYDFSTGEAKEILSDVDTFSLAKDDKFIVYIHWENDELWKYDLESKENEKLCNLKRSSGNRIVLSQDNQYVAYTDSKESFVPTAFKYYLTVCDVETGRRKVIYKGKYGESGINSLVW